MHTFQAQYGDPDYNYESVEGLRRAVESYPDRFSQSTREFIMSIIVDTANNDQVNPVE